MIFFYLLIFMHDVYMYSDMLLAAVMFSSFHVLQINGLRPQ